MKKKYMRSEQNHLYSSDRLNFALQVIKQKCYLPSCRFAMEQIAVPLSEILATKGDNASFSVYPNGDP